MAKAKKGIYIHLHRDKWNQEKGQHGISMKDVQNAYINQKRRYSAGISVLKYKSVYKAAMEFLKSDGAENSSQLSTPKLESAYNTIDTFRSGTGESPLTLARINIADGLTNLIRLSKGKKEEALDRIIKELEKLKVSERVALMQKLNKEWETYKKAAKHLKDNIDGIIALKDVEDLKKAQTTFAKTAAKYKGNEAKAPSVEDMAEEIRLIGTAIGSTFSGGAKEFFQQVGGVLGVEAREKILEEVNKHSKQSGITGTRIRMSDKGEGGSFSKDASGTSHKSKADNAIIIETKATVGKTKGEIYLGISEKSYTDKAFAWGTTGHPDAASMFLGGTNYTEIFNRTHNLKVENYFVNEYVHTKGAVANDPNDIVMKYITAKVASYALSGADDSKLAYFLRMKDDILYIPALLTQMGKMISEKQNSYLRLSVVEQSPITPNESFPAEKGDENGAEEAGLDRSQQIYEDLKTSLKFNMGVGDAEFYNLLKGLARYDV